MIVFLFNYVPGNVCRYPETHQQRVSIPSCVKCTSFISLSPTPKYLLHRRDYHRCKCRGREKYHDSRRHYNQNRSEKKMNLIYLSKILRVRSMRCRCCFVPEITMHSTCACLNVRVNCYQITLKKYLIVWWQLLSMNICNVSTM